MNNRNILKYLLITISILIFYGVNPLFSKNPIILSDNNVEPNFLNKVELLNDRSGKITINDLLERNKKYNFHKIKKNDLMAGMTKSSIWLRFSVKKDSSAISKSPWMLELENPNICLIDFYQVSSELEIIREVHTGTLKPVDSRDQKYMTFVFYLNFSDDSEYNVYMRFKSESSLDLNFSVFPMTEFMSNSYKDTIGTGIFLGFFIIMVGYNLFLFFSIRENIYLYFSLSIASLLLFLIVESGIGQLYLWPEVTKLNYYLIPSSLVLLLLFFTIFTDHFVKAKIRLKNFHKLFVSYYWILLILSSSVFIFGYFYSIIAIMIFSIIIFLSVMVSTYISWKKGDSSSGYFILSYTPIFLIGILSILEKLKIFTLCPDSNFSRKIGSTFFILLISLALGDRIKKMKIEKARIKIDLKESKDRFRDMVENSYDLIFELDPEQNFSYVSPNVKKIIGYSSDEIAGENFSRFLSEKDKYIIPDLIQTKIDKREPIVELRNTLISKKGKEIVFETNAVPYFSDSGKLMGLRCINRNITKRVRAEEILTESENRFKTIVENSHSGIINVDNSYKFTYVNPQFETLLGYSSEELIGRDFRDFLDKESLEIVTERYKKRQAGEDVPSKYRFNVMRSDGQLRRIEISSAVVRMKSNIPVTVAQLLDITEKERSEKMTEIILNISQAANFTKSVNEFYEVIHKELSKIIETKNFFVGLYDRATDSIFLPYLKDEKDEFEKVPAKGTISSLVIKENRSMILRPEDIKKLEDSGKIDVVGTPSKIWLGVPLRTGNDVIGVIVVQSYTDMNAYDRTDLELLEFVSDQIAIAINKKRSEEKIGILTQSIEQGPSIIMITDMKGNIEYVNKKFTEITGYSSKEVLGKNPRILKSGETPESIYSELWSAISSGNEWRGEFINKKKDGTLYWEDVFITCIRNSEGNFTNFLAIKNDITERKRMEQQLIQSQKMESIGTLAGGIAHDFNNLLTVINGYSDMLLMKFKNGDPTFKELSAIRSAGDRAEKLTRQIMAFSRKQIYKPQIVEINSIILELETMFRSLLGEDIDIKTDLSSNLPFIKADPGQIEQILINLLVNSRDAVNQRSDKPEEKKITIETSMKIIDESFVKGHMGSSAGKHICLSVSDTGIGMSKEVKDSIFEPFFTTKARNKGTGLGLATVYGIVKQNRGSIYVYSEPGIGSTFKIYWPATDEELIIKDSSVFNRKALTGTEKVLVVEDNRQVLDFASETLRNFGYQVYSAPNGKKALSLFSSEKIKMDLLITDLIMPDMNGKELAEEIQRLSPETKILFASGYTDNHLVHKGQLKEDINFLPKPYSTRNLLKSVREVLDKKG